MLAQPLLLDLAFDVHCLLVFVIPRISAANMFWVGCVCFIMNSDLERLAQAVDAGCRVGMAATSGAPGAD